MQEIWKTLTTNKDDGWQRYNWTKKRMHCSIQVVKPISKFSHTWFWKIYTDQWQWHIKMDQMNYQSDVVFFRIEFSARKWTWVSIQMILYFVKNHTKQIFYPRQKIKLDRLGILTKRYVKYFKKSNFWIVSL